jgi:phosphoheptose isomerase
MTRRFALVDRDGTINVERNHITDPDQIELIPGSAEALVRLRDELGMGIVVVTNQAHVGRGLLSLDGLDRIHDRLQALLALHGAGVDAIEACPHAPEDGCSCRKPAPGLALRAAERFGFEPTSSFVIGDHAGDMQLGRRIGATTIQVLTGHGKEEREGATPFADHVAPDLAGAVDIIASLVPTPGADAGRMTLDREDAARRARTYLTDTSDLMRSVVDVCLDDIVEAAARITGSFRADGTLLICGNGGSAADAQHLATEFVSTLTVDHPRPAMRAVALTTDTSLLTAIGNDFGVDGIFARQVEALGRSGDVLLGISTSGNSANVLAAAERAAAMGLTVLALTGRSGGKLAPLADVAIRIPSDVTAHIQEAHLASEQLLALIVERELYPAPVSPEV